MSPDNTATPEAPPRTWPELLPWLGAVPGLDASKLAQLQVLANLVTEWNERVNVISRKDIQHLPERHILHSLCIARYIQFQPGTSVLDLGTGGGFPGMPLAICFPQVQFTLLDSTQKKLKVIVEIATTLGLKNVHTVWQRAEEHTHQYDFVTGRAVADLRDFFPLAIKRVHCKNRNALPNGILYLKGGELAEELRGIRVKKSVVHALRDWLPDPYFETKQLVYLSNCG